MSMNAKLPHLGSLNSNQLISDLMSQRHIITRTYTTAGVGVGVGNGEAPKRKRLSLFLTNQDDPLKNKLSTMNNNQVMELTVEIFKKASFDRTLDDMKILIFATQNIEFFKKLLEEKGKKVLLDCLKKMTYESFKKEECVFQSGTVGTKFYVILKGSVGVLMNVQRQIKMEDKSENLKLITVLDEVNTQGVGSSFGELALIHSQARKATIKCKENCEFAVLDKDNFRKILAQAELEAINQKIDFIRKVPGFQKLTKGTLTNLIYFFQTITYSRNQTVYSENDEAQDIYIIKSGEFKITKKIKLQKDNLIKFSENDEMKVYISNLTSQYKCKKLELAVIGEGQIFGEEEVYQNIDRRTTSVECIKNGSEVFKISKKDVQKRINEFVNPESLKEFTKYSETKRNFRERRIKEMQSVTDETKNLLTCMAEKHDKSLFSEENPVHTSLLEKSRENRMKKRPNVSFDSFLNKTNAADNTEHLKLDTLKTIDLEKEDTFFLTKPELLAEDSKESASNEAEFDKKPRFPSALDVSKIETTSHLKRKIGDFSKKLTPSESYFLPKNFGKNSTSGLTNNRPPKVSRTECLSSKPKGVEGHKFSIETVLENKQIIFNTLNKDGPAQMPNFETNEFRPKPLKKKRHNSFGVSISAKESKAHSFDQSLSREGFGEEKKKTGKCSGRAEFKNELIERRSKTKVRDFLPENDEIKRSFALYPLVGSSNNNIVRSASESRE